jgi:hypothetical protein
VDAAAGKRSLPGPACDDAGEIVGSGKDGAGGWGAGAVAAGFIGFEGGITLGMKAFLGGIMPGGMGIMGMPCPMNGIGPIGPMGIIGPIGPIGGIPGIMGIMGNGGIIGIIGIGGWSGCCGGAAFPGAGFSPSLSESWSSWSWSFEPLDRFCFSCSFWSASGMPSIP